MADGVRKTVLVNCIVTPDYDPVISLPGSLTYFFRCRLFPPPASSVFTSSDYSPFSPRTVGYSCNVSRPCLLCRYAATTLVHGCLTSCPRYGRLSMLLCYRHAYLFGLLFLLSPCSCFITSLSFFATQVNLLPLANVLTVIPPCNKPLTEHSTVTSELADSLCNSANRFHLILSFWNFQIGTIGELPDCPYNHGNYCPLQ